MTRIFAGLVVVGLSALTAGLIASEALGRTKAPDVRDMNRVMIALQLSAIAAIGLLLAGAA